MFKIDQIFQMSVKWRYMEIKLTHPHTEEKHHEFPPSWCKHLLYSFFQLSSWALLIMFPVFRNHFAVWLRLSLSYRHDNIYIVRLFSNPEQLLQHFQSNISDRTLLVTLRPRKTWQTWKHLYLFKFSYVSVDTASSLLWKVVWLQRVSDLYEV